MKKVMGCVVVGLLTMNACGEIANAQQRTSNETSITLLENNSTTPPKDPEKPSDNQNGEDPDNPATGNHGPLSLDVVPKGFYFGTQKMYHAAHEYQATGTEKHNQYLQVTDNRDAGIYGWSVKVKQDHYLKNGQTNVSLNGATLVLPKGTPRNSISNEGDSTRADENLLTSMVEVTDVEKTIFTAPSDVAIAAGKATSTNTWASDQVLLRIPKDTAKEGNYSNTIYWTLSTNVTK